jgi:hypothetical protein
MQAISLNRFEALKTPPSTGHHRALLSGARKVIGMMDTKGERMRRGEVAPTSVLKEQQNQVRWTPTCSRIVDDNTTYTRGICSPGMTSLRRACGSTTSPIPAP